MNTDIHKKVEQAIKLLQTIQRAVGEDTQIELAYSGGKDSDVILQLARMAKINIRPIYKNTTIDPPGTIAHVKAKGVEIVRPKESFFDIIAAHGFPSRWARFCCSTLKEYKILDNCIVGVRRAESAKRAALYDANEPTRCRIYGSKENHVNQILPILNWTNQDVADFVNAYGVQCHPLYYDRGGGHSTRNGGLGAWVARYHRTTVCKISRNTRSWYGLGFEPGKNGGISPAKSP